MDATKKTATEVGVILDSLAALSQDLACHGRGPPDALVLSAGKAQDACLAIDNAVASLKEILAISVAEGGGPVPAAVEERLDDASTG